MTRTVYPLMGMMMRVLLRVVRGRALEVSVESQSDAA